jgi:DNA-binding transcriptional ArsR family regulator/2-polyprenyl-3-methyl-5-hydroxy-6-metoxy-1,4-benzoquinol methylase
VPSEPQPVIPIFHALADAQRARMLRILAREELAVGEIAAALQLPQSTMSRQLKALFEAGLVSKRAEGTATYYRLVREALSAEARAAWDLLRGALRDDAAFADDDRRLTEVLAARGGDAKGFFGRVGGEWSGLRRGLFGERFASEALLALVPAAWTVADLGCGTGEIAAELAPFVRKVIAIDREPAMLEASRRRLREFANVEVRRGDLVDLPAKAGEFNACVLSLVLHHVPAPAEVLAAARRALAKDGVVIVIDMVAHARSEYRTTMGHEHLGFAEDDMRALASAAKLTLSLYRPLRPAIESKGPGLFVARLVK